MDHYIVYAGAEELKASYTEHVRYIKYLKRTEALRQLRNLVATDFIVDGPVKRPAVLDSGEGRGATLFFPTGKYARSVGDIKIKAVGAGGGGGK